MKWRRRLTQWELRFEQAPKTQIVKKLALVFGVSIIAGYTLSMIFTIFQTTREVQTLKSMEIKEKERLTDKLKTLHTLRYESGKSN